MRVGVIVLALLAGCAAPAVPPVAEVAAPVRPRRTPPDRVAALLKATPAAVEAALGSPVLRRPEGSGEVWLYAHASGCSIDIVMLSTSGRPLVAHAATRTPVAMSEAECLRVIAEASP